MGNGDGAVRATLVVMSDATTPSTDPVDPSDAADGAQTHETTPDDGAAETATSDGGSANTGNPNQDRADLMDLPPADATGQG